MHIDTEEFNVADVPANVWEFLLGNYKGKELLKLIKRNENLLELTHGFQLASRNIKQFRKSILAGCANDVKYASELYFDWLEDQESLDKALKEIDQSRDDEDDTITIETKTVKKWMSDGVPKETLWVYLHCSADRFSGEAFKLVDPPA